ncbi:uracil-DNA glycosylase [Candidatus Magnetomoraceae bacterium gMMP-15]
MIIEDIKNYLLFLKEHGCEKLELSEDSLELIKSWKNPNKIKFKPENSQTYINTLKSLKTKIQGCKRCNLYKNRKNIVFGAGNPHARLVFIGKGPDFEEDKEGIPFVGPAGQLLTKIIHAINQTRESVYLCNIIKCLIKNSDPGPDEIKACLPFLEKQLAVIKPKFICTLGNIASQALLGSKQDISSLRGHFHNYKGIQVMPTYHPAFLLNNEHKKRDVWEDMQKLMKKMNIRYSTD